MCSSTALVIAFGKKEKLIRTPVIPKDTFVIPSKARNPYYSRIFWD
jgi:hypothetical protein